jgi:putative ABC transport system permease protein
MRVVQLAFRNARRSPLRGAMTVLAVAISLVAFVLLRAVSAGWTERVAQTPNDRVVTRHRLNYRETLPVHYSQLIREMPGVDLAMGGRWVGAKLPGDRPTFFESFAVEAEPFIAMHHELVAPEAQKRAFLSDRRCVLVSKALAQEVGWKLGDNVFLEGTRIPGRLQVVICGVFTSTRYGWSVRTLWMHWDYHNEILDPSDRDRLDFVAARIEDPNQGATIARAIDMRFDQYEPATLSQEDRALNASLIGRFSAILDVLDVLSLMILGVVVLILGNTIAMSVAERTKEYATLRAIGFLPHHLAVLVLGEAAALGIAGGVLGLALAYPLIESSLSRFLQENLGFAPLQVPLASAVMSVLLGGVLALTAASLPAHRIARSSVTQALREVI